MASHLALRSLMPFWLCRLYQISSAAEEDIDADPPLRLRRRTKFAMVYTASAAQRCSLWLFVCSHPVLLVSMQCEVAVVLFLAQNEWETFDHLLLWSFHLAVARNASFQRARRFVLKLDVAFLALSVDRLPPPPRCHGDGVLRRSGAPFIGFVRWICSLDLFVGRASRL